jgi:bifunctional DNase/RNase
MRKAVSVILLSCAPGGALLASGGCGPHERGAVFAPVATVNMPAQSGASAVPPPLAASAPKLPVDAVEVTVLAVGATGDGDAVLLGDETRRTVLPILIGGTEALSIQLRFERRRYERPLTHDLLDSILKDLGAEVVRVEIDDLVENTFLAAVVLRHDGRYSRIDARPSDAIALALGAGAPIYVSRKVLARAGVNKDDRADDAGPPVQSP